MKRTIISVLTALALTIALLLTPCLLVGSNATDANKLPFKDVKSGQWFYGAVYEMYISGFMEGKSTKLFEPNSTMTRAELVTLMSRLADKDTTGFNVYAEKFSDVGKKSWFTSAVGWAAKEGLAQGYDGNLFKPNAPIKRMELATFIVRLVDYLDLNLPENEKIKSFSDAVTFPNWAKDTIESMRLLGLVEGDTSGRFYPYREVTRAEVATIVSRFSSYITADPMHAALSNITSVLDSENGRSVIVLGGETTVNESTLSRIIVVCGTELDESKYSAVFDTAQIDGLKNGAYRDLPFGSYYDTELNIALKNNSTGETTDTLKLSIRIRKVADLDAEMTPEFVYKIKLDGSAEITDYIGVRFVKHLTIPSTLGGARVTSIGKEAFKESRELVSINIPDGVTFIDTEAFSLCTSLESVIIPESVTKVGRAAFYYCTSLKSVTLPKNLERIPDYMFYMCTSLANAVTYDALEEVGKYAFSNCVLENFNFNEGLEIVGEYAFEGCMLTKVYLPDSCTYAGHWAFYNCLWLDEASFGDNLELIGSGVLYNTSVSELDFRGSSATYATIYKLSAFDEEFPIVFEK